MKDINFNIKSIPKLLKRVLQKLERYSVIIFFVSAVGACSFLVYQIGSASQSEPNQDVLTQQINSVKRLKIDKQSIEKIEQLEDQNVNVQSLFKSARDNPFQEE
jgi:hypothetical protein